MLMFHPYLNFNGDCRDAMEYYHRVLGGKLDVQTFGESPMADQSGPEMKDRVLHARLAVGDAVLMASDAPVEKYERPHGFAVSINVDGAADADRIFNALADGGSVSMPIQETFWAERFGMCVDRFGTPWMVNCAKVMAAASS
jgi:PhnB protein